MRQQRYGVPRSFVTLGFFTVVIKNPVVTLFQAHIRNQKSISKHPLRDPHEDAKTAMMTPMLYRDLEAPSATSQFSGMMPKLFSSRLHGTSKFLVFGGACSIRKTWVSTGYHHRHLK
jgi:hypothetical protein